MSKNKIKSKKAQTALEYLMTYGWAILVIIIVGSALYALGVFNPGTWTGKRTSGFVQFQMVDFKVSTANSNVSLVLGNRLGKSVTITSIDATYKNLKCTYDVPDVNFGPNEQKTYGWQCGDAGKWNTGSMPVRTSYTVIIDIHYTDPDSGLSHIDSGTLFGAVEPA